MNVYNMLKSYTSETRVRTNIEIDENLLAQAMKVAGTKTKKATVQEALELLVRIRGQRAIRALRGKIDWQGDLDSMRRD